MTKDRKRPLSKLFGLAAPAILATILIAQAPAVMAQEAIKQGGTLISAITDNPPNFITGLGTDITTIAIGGEIFNTLIKLDDKLNLVPSLAKSWEISPDGLTYTFHLQEGVKWHDGQPFTSADVKYTFQELSGKYNSLAIQAYKGIASIDTPDDNTVVVKLAKPDPSFFPWAFCQPNFAQIFPKHIYEGSDPRTNPANLKPIGTGPFVFKEWNRGSNVVLERNPDYFNKDHVFLDRLVFQIIPDPGATQLALQKGDIDYIPYSALSTSALAPLSKDPNIQVIDSLRPALGEIMMFYNLREPQLAKPEVRQAIAHLVDRDLLVKLALNGHGKAATGPIRSDQPPFYDADIPKYAHDVALANDLLDKAGFPKDGNGTRFSLRLSYQGTGEGGALQSAAEIMRQQLKEGGIDLQLMPTDSAAWLDSAFMKWDFDLTMGSFGTGPDPKIGVNRLYSTSTIQKVVGGNLMGYSNPKLDDLFNKADAEMDPKVRADDYHQAQQILGTDLPALWLWEKSYPIAVRKGIVGLPAGAMHSEVFEDVGQAN
ncbi:MAG TPA: ABC transporter substrate-binding protein [Devosiaceae bacterium]|jgi:peptide/nickel transport system substrate-binding protein